MVTQAIHDAQLLLRSHGAGGREREREKDRERDGGKTVSKCPDHAKKHTQSRGFRKGATSAASSSEQKKAIFPCCTATFSQHEASVCCRRWAIGCSHINLQRAGRKCTACCGLYVFLIPLPQTCSHLFSHCGFSKNFCLLLSAAVTATDCHLHCSGAVAPVIFPLSVC